MSRPQLIVIAVALLLAAGMFFLPKVVINKDKKGDFTGQTAAAKTEGETEDHTGHDHAPGEGHEAENAAHKAATPAQLQAIAGLKKRYDASQDAAAKVALARDLGSAYQEVGKFDSAGYYFESYAAAKPSEKNYERAAGQYFEAFSFAATEERTKFLGEKVQAMYGKVLELNPENLDAKTNLAMTYISGPNPMQGIGMLREVLEKDPKNEKAQYNMGVLSMQSRQFAKAVERFRKVLEVNPDNVDANFYLGVALSETGQKAEAEKVFRKVKTLNTNPEVQASVDEYLQKLQQKQN